MARVLIALAMYRGAGHIGAQLDSIAAQSHGDWRLIVSDDGPDDGPDDGGPAIVHAFATRWAEGRVTYVTGPRVGATRNFLSLITHARPDEFLSLADQDDVWRPDKLERALAVLADTPRAGLYSARTTICDPDLRPLAGSRRFSGPFDFRNALVQAVTAGNTCVLTPPAVALAAAGAGAAAAAGIESHDWWLYQLISGAGMTVLRDDAEVLLYRQHPGNLKGRNDTLAAMRSRLGQLFDGDYAGWLHANITALTAMDGALTAESRRLLAGFDAALSLPGWRAAPAMARLGLRRQTMAGNAALYAAALAGRLRRRG
ncbi:MAG: glycosyltransferase [Paracoccus sp. (in: a-proteobacteria)]|nr:glycosyltransferase [Paracoccus sp. (in: a-proteobacteria)]